MRTLLLFIAFAITPFAIYCSFAGGMTYFILLLAYIGISQTNY